MSNDSNKFVGVWRHAGTATLTAGMLSLVYWYRRLISSAILGKDLHVEYSLLDQFLPQAEFVGEVCVAIHAPAHTIFDALQRLTINDMPLAKWLGTVRYLPGLLVGKSESVAAVQNRPFLQVVQSEGGNIVLADEPNREFVIGAVGKFHNLLDQQVVSLDNAQDFVDFAQPEYQKLAMSFRLIPLDDASGYRLILTHRTHALSREARWKFALYWLGIKPGGNFISWLMLRAVKSLAEKATVDVAL